MLNKEQVLAALRDTSQLPLHPRDKFRRDRRTIYETGEGSHLKASGRFCIDYASYPGGAIDEVPRSVIDELEKEGKIRRAYPDATINAWVLYV